MNVNETVTHEGLCLSTVAIILNGGSTKNQLFRPARGRQNELIKTLINHVQCCSESGSTQVLVLKFRSCQGGIQGKEDHEIQYWYRNSSWQTACIFKLTLRRRVRHLMSDLFLFCFWRQGGRDGVRCWGNCSDVSEPPWFVSTSSASAMSFKEDSIASDWEADWEGWHFINRKYERRRAAPDWQHKSGTAEMDG